MPVPLVERSDVRWRLEDGLILFGQGSAGDLAVEGSEVLGGAGPGEAGDALVASGDEGLAEVGVGPEAVEGLGDLVGAVGVEDEGGVRGLFGEAGDVGAGGGCAGH